MAASTLSLNHAIPRHPSSPPRRLVSFRRRPFALSPAASRADDSSAFDMSVESALELLGVPEGASFDEILTAKKRTVADCKDDVVAVAKVGSLDGNWSVEAAYDMLLMQSLTRRRAGKVLNSGVRYADVKPIRPAATNSLPPWMQSATKGVPLSVETPSANDLGIGAGVYGTLIALTYVTGTSSYPAGSNNGADIPGLILATGFGASLYFLTKKNVKLGKAALITAGGLVVGAIVGSAVENLLQVDIVPFLGIRSPAVVVTEFVLFSQLLASLYLR